MTDQPDPDAPVGRWYGGKPGFGWHAGGPSDPWPEMSDEPEALVGTRIRFFWDYCAPPWLWNDEGLLPDDPEWLERELGLSPSLVADILAWGNSKEQRIAGQSSAAASQDDSQDEQRRLSLRLRGELHVGLTLEEDT